MSRAYIRNSIPVQILGDKILTIESPPLIWYWEFLFPLLKQEAIRELAPELKLQAMAALAKGEKLDQDTLMSLPMPMLDVARDVVVDFFWRADEVLPVDKPATREAMTKQVMQELDLVDFLAIIQGILKVIDIKRVAGFFGEISGQLQDLRTLTPEKGSRTGG